MARDERLDIGELVSRLPELLQEVLRADSALQSVPLGRIANNGYPLPFLFATRIASRITFQGFRSTENRLLFGLISSQRDQKLADLRFKASFIPGEPQSVVAGRGARDRLVLPRFFGYDAASERVFIESDDGRWRWTYRSSDDEEVIESAHGDETVLLEKRPTNRGYVFLTQLIRQLCEWRSADTRFLPVGTAINPSPEGGDNELHFRDLVHAQRAMVGNLGNYLGAVSGDAEDGATGLVSPDVLSRRYRITSLRVDVLANLDRAGNLILKGVPDDAQQFDIRSTLAMDAYHRIVSELSVPDILTDGPIWGAICEGIIDRALSFSRALDEVNPLTGNRKLANWFKLQFGVWRRRRRISKKLVKSWLGTQYEAGRITIVRFQQGKTSDVDLVWVRGLPKSPEDEVFFLAEVTLDHYPDVVVQRIRNVAVAGIRITGEFEQFFRTDYWKHGIDYCFRMMAVVGEWFRFAERSMSEREAEDV